MTFDSKAHAPVNCSKCWFCQNLDFRSVVFLLIPDPVTDQHSPSLYALRPTVQWTNQNKAKKQDKQALSVLAAPFQAVISGYFRTEQTLSISISSMNGFFAYVGWIS
jgi:hypothetical protein